MLARKNLTSGPFFQKRKPAPKLKCFTVVYVFILVTSNPRFESPSSGYINITQTISISLPLRFAFSNLKMLTLKWGMRIKSKKERCKRIIQLPISLLAFVEAGYRTVDLFPILGSSVAKTFPVAENH